MKLAAPGRQGLKGANSGFVLGMPNLQRSEKRAGVNEQKEPYVRSG